MSSVNDLVDVNESAHGGSVLMTTFINPLILQAIAILIVIILIIMVFQKYIWPVVEPVYTYVLKPVGGVIVSTVKSVF